MDRTTGLTTTGGECGLLHRTRLLLKGFVLAANVNHQRMLTVLTVFFESRTDI